MFLKNVSSHKAKKAKLLSLESSQTSSHKYSDHKTFFFWIVLVFNFLRKIPFIKIPITPKKFSSLPSLVFPEKKFHQMINPFSECQKTQKSRHSTRGNFLYWFFPSSIIASGWFYLLWNVDWFFSSFFVEMFFFSLFDDKNK